jgi:hypothetical protein
MPVEILKCEGGSFLVPMDGPWQSEEDNAAYKAAVEKYNELVAAGNAYVALIESHHEYSHGYWIETKQSAVDFPDHILKEHKA